MISGTKRTRRHRSRGQSLVEFSLVIPIFLTVFFAIVEFSFLFTSFVSIGFASHDAAQLAATYGNTTNADGAILQRVMNDVMTPASAAQIKTVDIFWVNTATGSGASLADELYTYDGGSHDFAMPSGPDIFLPFGKTTDGYPTAQRCNVNAGIGCPNTGALVHGTVDTIGVKITYQYTWITPFPQLIGGSGNGPLITQTTLMRLEPVL
jgi:TadE-like protein